MKARFHWFLAATTLLAGCGSPKLTNLTPGRLPRNPANVYPFEVAWKPKRRVVKDEVGAFVMIDLKAYPMTRVPMVDDRWEARIPLPAESTQIPYQYKFVYRYPGGNLPKQNSKLSPIYRLDIPSN